jgi:hypothetical protein
MGNYNIKRRGNVRRNHSYNPPNNKNQIIEEKMDEDLFKPLKNSRERSVINKWERLTGMPDIAISFISDPPGTSFYSSRFQSLITRVQSLGYDYIFYHYVSDRNYFQNCCYKPYFIQSILRETNKNVLWIDGDTFLKSNLDQLMNKNKSFDLGLVSYTHSMDSFVASPIYFVNTETTNLIVDAWEKNCTERVEAGQCELDHDALKHSILPYYKERVKINLCDSDLHRGEVLENVNSEVPDKRNILLKMREVNKNRPFPHNEINYNLV